MVGVADGFLDGSLDDGFMVVGSLVGSCVGSLVGSCVGLLVGFCEGNLEG